MISTQDGSKFNIAGVLPSPLTHASFKEDSVLWKKEKHFKGFQGKELKAARYPYYKMGKTLGFETRRFLAQHMGHLFYFAGSDEEQYLGYLQLHNVYLQWLPLKCKKFLLVLSNGNDTSLFYFEEPSFWELEGQEISKYAIQLNFAERYHIEDLIGEGSFSQVHKVQCKRTGKSLAAKVIKKTDKKEMSTKDMVDSERRILHMMKHETGISQFREFYETNDSYVILLDYIPGVSLMQVWEEKKYISLPRLKELFIDILNILKECHSRNIIHRDIKPHNIIISHDGLEPKLIDFGLAMVTNKDLENHCYCKCGTVGYTAPQVLLNDSLLFKSYGYKCDIFSFGVVAHMLLMGSNPIAGKENAQIVKEFNVELNEKEIIRKYDYSCLHFLQKLMAANPKHRYSAEQALQCSFLTGSSDRQESISTIESGCYLDQRG